jgi:hypothetical protein
MKFLCLILILTGSVVAMAADQTWSTLQPQASDSNFTLNQKQTAALAALASGSVITGTLVTGTGVLVPISATIVDISGTVTTTGSSQQLVAGSSRKFLLLQNIGASTLYVNFGAVATTGTGSIQVAPQGFLSFGFGYVPSDAIFVTGSAGVIITGKQY